MKLMKCLSLFFTLCLLLTAAAACSDDCAPEGGVDVDLTLLSSVMVYAEVSNIAAKPVEYIGKTIKVNGPYYASFYDETGLFYHYVLLLDASGCCTQGGFEFIWNGNHTYPDDFPAEYEEIEVTGVYSSYEELGQIYYYLAVDELVILS